MKFSHIFWTFLHVQTCVNAFLNTALMASFFDRNTLKYGAVLTCLNKEGRAKLSKNLTRQTNALLTVKDLERLQEGELAENSKKWGFVVDGDCPTVQSSLAQLSRLKLFDVRHFWLILHRTSNYLHLFKEAVVNVDANIQVAYYDELIIEQSFISIDDVYNPASEKGGQFKTVMIGQFHIGSGHQLVLANTDKYANRKDFSGVTFKSTIVLPYDFDGPLDRYLRSDKNTDINTFNRFQAKLMSVCQDYHNFSMNVSRTKSWGYKQKNGSFDGLLSDFVNDKSDFGLSPIYVRKERLPVVTYGRNTWPFRIAFVLRNPKSRRSFEIFVKPLSAGVWICIVVSLSLSISIQRLCCTLDKKLVKSPRTADTSWSYILISTCGALCQQGLCAFPYSFSGRTTGYVTLLFGVLIYQFYSASLVSFLLNAPTTVIRTPKDILDSDFRLGCEDVAHEKTFFEKGSDSITKEMYRRMTLSNRSSGFLKPEDGLSLVKRGKYAFHVELVTAYPIIEKQFEPNTICELTVVYVFPPARLFTAYQKFSPFKDLFDICLQKLGENGVLVRELIFWHSRKPECLSRKIDIQTGIEEFYPALCILAFGIAVSLQVLTIETLWHRRSMERKAQLFPYTE